MRGRSTVRRRSARERELSRAYARANERAVEHVTTSKKVWEIILDIFNVIEREFQKLSSGEVR